MVGINSSKPPFTSKILHYDFHKRSIAVKKIRKRKNSSESISMLKLDERLVIFQVKMGLFEPFLAMIWNLGGFGY